ncbi:hypothetical protein F2Q69_00059132 [Brassica cretica]|uniref:Uncharacterized protein n=1 Tax=Brassica cretica TaxID=69181 RepID=A0A8S9RPF4_BRACR|nr:hypothetical protein F2Q69_00059132 [Brassica cretica]
MRHQTRARKRSLRNDRTRVPLGRYVATELEGPSRSVAIRSAQPLRSDQARAKLGCYVATEGPSRLVTT